MNLSASDALSGVAATHWSLDGGATQTGTQRAGHDRRRSHAHLLTASTTPATPKRPRPSTCGSTRPSPTIGHTQSPLANLNGWNNTNVTVTFTCADALSGIASCTTPQTVTTEGQNQPVTGTALDNAGNTATDPATVSIDKTKPTITSARDRAPNANDWYDADVTVTYTCADALSGVDTCSAPQTLRRRRQPDRDRIGHRRRRQLRQRQRHAASTSTRRAPTITGAPTTSPNANGWYNGDVTIHWTCSDALSGIAACPADSRRSPAAAPG